MPMAATGCLTHLWSLFNYIYGCGCSLLSYLEALYCKTFSSLVIELLTLHQVTIALDGGGCSWRVLQRMLVVWGSNKKRGWNHKNLQEFGLAGKSRCGIKYRKLCIILRITFWQRDLQNSLNMRNPHFLPVRHDTNYELLYNTNPG